MSSFGLLTCMGRSGSLWISELLDLQDNINSNHERQTDDQLLHGLHGQSKLVDLDVEYWKKIAENEIGDNDHYISVNCRLRYHLGNFLRDDDINVACQARHGVKVVSSYMDRNNTFKFPHWTAEAVIPPYSLDEWLNMSRFKRICHHYRYFNEWMLDRDVTYAKLEKINESYDYFCSNVCSPLEIKVDKKHWEQKRKNPSHQGSYNMSREYDEWTNEQQEIFDRTCGYIMDELGYEY